ncbi:MAG: CoA transferase [Chloroflexi bacterium]|nr:CoA transferase [Chloroflexota bacterium]MDA1146253.1 CoA transferase [Chloroflexota bacterium]
MTAEPAQTTALEGLRILDMTQYEAGTSCTQALAWLGADVVKVEPPVYGDPGRRVRLGQGNSPYFLNWNSNKRSIVLDLAQPEGRQLLLDMAPHYDVFVENYGPGVVEKLDIGYEVMKAANPSIIYARLKGFGTSGPYADYKCFDMVAQAAAGAFSVTGERGGPPMRPGPTTGDAGTGVQLALAITAAYVQKQRTGQGQLIEISMQEAMTYFMRTQIANGSDWGNTVTQRNGNGPTAPVNLYPCKGSDPNDPHAERGPNDYAFVMCVTTRMWDSLCAAMDRSELTVDPRFETPEARVEHADALYEEIAAWTTQHSKYEVMRILGEAGVPVSANLDTYDLFHDPHLTERGFVHTLQHPEHGEIRLLGWAPRMSASHVPIRHGPLMGEHSDEILEADLGLDADRLAALRSKGVVS